MASTLTWGGNCTRKLPLMHSGKVLNDPGEADLGRIGHGNDLNPALLAQPVDALAYCRL